LDTLKPELNLLQDEIIPQAVSYNVTVGNCRRISDKGWSRSLEINKGAGFTNQTCEDACTKNPKCVAFDFCTGTKPCTACNEYRNDSRSAYNGSNNSPYIACHIKNPPIQDPKPALAEVANNLTYLQPELNLLDGLIP